MHAPVAINKERALITSTNRSIIIKSENDNNPRPYYFTGMQYPTCAVSKAKYLTRAGWVNFKNQSDLRTPFQIHRENGHIMLLVCNAAVNLYAPVYGIIIGGISRKVTRFRDASPSICPFCSRFPTIRQTGVTCRNEFRRSFAARQ